MNYYEKEKCKKGHVSAGSSSSFKPEKKEHATEIFEYIRKRKAGRVHKVGVIVGVNNDGIVKVGWSQANLKAGDKFDVSYGLNLARNRIGGAEMTPKTPDGIRRQVRQFGARAVRYFKDAKTIMLPV